jgi:hypothetical protein
VLFHWSTITAPSSTFNLQGYQFNTLGWKKMAYQDVKLWDANCNRVGKVTLTTVNGYPVLKVTGATPGAIYYFSVKYSPSSLKGIAVTKPYPTATYTFQTRIKVPPSTTWQLVAESSDSVVVRPK